MHFIQKQILDKLRANNIVRYAEINTANVESGHFRYHLKQLVTDGSVDQIDRGLYKLTPAGQMLVDRLSENRINPRSMPKVITYTLLTSDDNILLYKKHKQPYEGLFNMIGGKLHEGESSQDASVREVHEKTSLDVSQPKLAGVFEIIINNKTDLLSHAIAYVYTARIKDYSTSKLKPFTIEELKIAKDLAPDFMALFTKIWNSTEICIGNLDINYDLMNSAHKDLRLK